MKIIWLKWRSLAFLKIGRSALAFHIFKNPENWPQHARFSHFQKSQAFGQKNCGRPVFMLIKYYI